MKKILLFIALDALISFGVSAQTNKVYWVHGLNDNMSSVDSTEVWQVFKTTITTNTAGSSIQWSGHKSLTDAGSELLKTIKKELPSGRAIVFGHSAGGLVARNAAKNSAGKIRAVITAGTPNNGAGIVTSLQDRSFNNVADKAITKINISISAGSLAIGTVTSGLKRTIMVLLGITPAFLNNAAQSLAKDYIDDAKDSFYNELAVKDMDPDLTNNTFLSNLNAAPPTVPIINLYGNEDDKRLVRIAGTAMHRKEANSSLNINQNTYDESAIPIYNTTLATCITFEVAHASLGTTLGVLAIYYPKYWASCALNAAAAVSWNDTRRFIQYDVHNEWDKIIGATHVEKEEEWHKFLWKQWSTVKYVTVYDASDGFIPNSSSIMDVTASPQTINIEVPGVNHLEMNSHPEMKSHLENILKNSRYGDAFNPNK